MTETVSSKQYAENEKLINEEFKIWKKSVPLLYDTIQTFALPTPSLTVEPLPQLELSNDKNEVEAKFLMGTYSHTSSNNVELWSVKLPSTLSTQGSQSVPIPTGPSVIPHFSTLQKWPHEGEVNKARYNSKLHQFATFTNSGAVQVWGFDSESPVSTLQYHKKEGFALEWAVDGASRLLSGAEDGKIALWDVQSPEKPTQVYEHHNAIVNDFAWNYSIPTLFGSVSDDISIHFVDTRASIEPLVSIQDAHKDVINAIEFNPSLDNVFVTGSADNLINVWDMRNTSQPVRVLYGHNGTINQLKFNSAEPNMLASSSSDRRIHIWDLQNLDEDFEADDYIKNDRDDPCLSFIHGGHTAKVSEFSWLPGFHNTLVSVGEDGLVEVWKPHLEQEDDEEEEEQVADEDKMDEEKMDEDKMDEDKPQED